MRSLLVIVACLSTSLLAGCCTKPSPSLVEDAEVARRCAPVKELLSKNYHRDGKLDLLLVSGGGMLDRTGAILSGAEATRVAELDQYCRAWAQGAIDDDTYARAILPIFSTTIAETTQPSEIAAVAASNALILAELRKRNLIPASADPAILPARAATDAQKTPEGRRQALVEQLSQISSSLGALGDNGGRFQGEVLRRLETLEARFDKRWPPAGDAPGSQPNPPPLPESLDVFFDTASADLSRDSRLGLRNAARAWRARTATVSVIGYADPRGDTDRNRALSQARANVVSAELERLGVKVARSQGAGVGEGNDYDLLRVTRIRVCAAGEAKTEMGC